MSTLSRKSNQSSGNRFTQYPNAVWYASIVLAAFVILWLLRHLFGSIRVETGLR